MRHFILLYTFGATYAARRAEFRQEHLRHAWSASHEGRLMLAGALTDPLDTGLLLFQGESAAVAEGFARTDPYVVNGLIERWRVREWATVVGAGAATPLLPEAAEPSVAGGKDGA